MRRLKTKIMAIALAFAVGVSAPATFATNNTTVASAATIKLNQTKVSLTVGKTAQLKLNGAKKAVTWSTSKKTVATVTKTGKVTAKAEGTATITAKSSGKKYTCKVTVTAKKVTSNEKTYTFENVTFQLPKEAVFESATVETLGMATIGLKDYEDAAIMLMHVNLEGTDMDYDLWKESIQELMATQIQALIQEEGSEDIVTDFLSEEVVTNLGKGFCTTYNVNENSKVVGNVCVYDMLINEHWVEVIYMNSDFSATPRLQATFDMLMKTIAVVE